MLCTKRKKWLICSYLSTSNFENKCFFVKNRNQKVFDKRKA